jgi:THO complex subunit 3
LHSNTMNTPTTSGSSSAGSTSSPSSSSSLGASSSTVDAPTYIEQSRALFARAPTRELVGHKKEVHSVAWNCTGRKLASGSVDQTARIWSITRASQDLELKGHTSSVHQLCWDPTNAERLATASADKTVKVWDTRTGKCSQNIKTHGANLNIAWSPDGGYIAVGNKLDQVTLIDTRKYETMKTLQFSIEINELAWSKETDFLLLTTGRGGVEVLRWPSLDRVCTLHAHTANCYCLKFSPRGEYFAVGSADALVSVWDFEEMACIRTFGRLQWPIRTVSFSYDSKIIASASEDLVIDLAHVETGEMVHQIKCNGAINTMAWHPQAHFLAYAEAERDKHSRDVGNITLWGTPPQ